MLAPHEYVGDKGFVGNGMINPFRSQPEENFQSGRRSSIVRLTKMHWVIEQVIANFKTWRTMRTDYHRPIGTFAETISAVIGLEF